MDWKTIKLELLLVFFHLSNMDSRTPLAPRDPNAPPAAKRRKLCKNYILTSLLRYSLQVIANDDSCA